MLVFSAAWHGKLDCMHLVLLKLCTVRTGKRLTTICRLVDRQWLNDSQHTCLGM